MTQIELPSFSMCVTISMPTAVCKCYKQVHFFKWLLNSIQSAILMLNGWNLLSSFFPHSLTFSFYVFKPLLGRNLFTTMIINMIGGESVSKIFSKVFTF